jgi:hypothetical protein
LSLTTIVFVPYYDCKGQKTMVVRDKKQW